MEEDDILEKLLGLWSLLIILSMAELDLLIDSCIQGEKTIPREFVPRLQPTEHELLEFWLSSPENQLALFHELTDELAGRKATFE